MIIDLSKARVSSGLKGGFLFKHLIIRDLDESIKRSASDRLGDLVPQVRARTSPGVFRDMALLGLCLELSFNVLYCRTQANLPTLMHFAEPAIWPSSIRTEDPTCANHVDVLTVWSVFPSNVHINILRGLPCRLESLHLKFRFEPGLLQGFFATWRS